MERKLDTLYVFKLWLRFTSGVSIHTPIQGMTVNVLHRWLSLRVSIHTPIQGVTLNVVVSGQDKDGFNPHTHTGCDTSVPVLILPSTRVSIHTPIQGVTAHFGVTPADNGVSIHTPIQGVTVAPVGRDLNFDVSIHTPIQGVTWAYAWLSWRLEFQSTHPYRVWHRGACKAPQPYRFNPHTHTGCDWLAKKRLPSRSMFQSTHPYRVWPLRRFRLGVWEQFQSTHPYRVWQKSA